MSEDVAEVSSDRSLMKWKQGVQGSRSTLVLLSHCFLCSISVRAFR